jgi:3-deoxy-manno-octulosonate cytidylyltransferase (CMP-KDO synthetase)
MSKAAVIIPARWASTRFPGKPLHLLSGKPLIQHVWEKASRAKNVASVIIATDDMRIAEAAFAFGAEVALTSPKCTSGTDRCAEVAQRLEGIAHIVNVQGDEPMIDPLLIGRLVTTLANEPALDMVTAAVRFGPEEDAENPNAVKVVLTRESNALYFSRSLIPFQEWRSLCLPQTRRNLRVQPEVFAEIRILAHWKTRGGGVPGATARPRAWSENPGAPHEVGLHWR